MRSRAVRLGRLATYGMLACLVMAFAMPALYYASLFMASIGIISFLYGEHLRD